MMKKNEVTIHSSSAEYLTYVVARGGDDQSFEIRYEDENIWLSQKMMAELYDVSVSAINQHLNTIFSDGELIKESVIKKYLITASDGKNYNTIHYNLQAIIAVGFKINNPRAVQFRKWAGQIVKDYTIQGWVMDKERLIKGHMFTDEYFERQLQQIREIRMSERKFYQKVTDLYSTAFDYAELQAERRIPMSMEDWAKRLDGFLEFNGNELMRPYRFTEKLKADIFSLHRSLKENHLEHST